MAKKIVYLVSGWENGSGWRYKNDILESEMVPDTMASIPEEAWEYITNALREKDSDELRAIAAAEYSDVSYEIQIVEFDGESICEEGSVIASEEKWESELAEAIIAEEG